MPLIDRFSLRKFTRWIFGKVFTVTAEGVENIPLTGGCILATNHLSRLDTPLLLNLVPRDDLAGLVADKYYYNPFFAIFVTTTGSVWINRESADFSAIRAGLSIIRNGGILGIAPEGTRSQVGEMIEAKNGTAMIAEKANVPIVTASISGTDRAMSEFRNFRKAKLHVKFSEPFMLSPISRENREADLVRNTEEIMCHIAANLPEIHRGFYKDHPRTLELLQA